MTDHREDTGARIERLRRATDSVRPRVDFTSRVVAAAAREAPPFDWIGDLSRAAWRLVPVAALAAAMGLVWAAHSEHAWNEALTAPSTAELDGAW